MTGKSLLTRVLSRISLVGILSASILAACGGSDGPPNTVDGKLAAVETELTTQSQVFCDCYAEAGYPSRAMCEIEFFSPVDAPTRACIVAAYELEPVASADYLDCWLATEKLYTDCEADSLVCADGMSLDLCDNDWSTRLQACPLLPTVVSAAIDACFTP